MVLSRESIEQMTEAELRQHVIIPLMEAMGYQGVFEWHGGAGELGKDVVGWKQNDLGNRRNLAVVAKRGRISGATNIGTVKTQVAQAFKTPYQDPPTGEDARIHQCWIAANGELKKEAREGIRAALSEDQDRDVEILDLNDLWANVQQYMLVGVHKTLEIVKERLKGSDTPFNVGLEVPSEGQPFASIEVDGNRFVLSERYPGQLDREPFTIQALFEFPDTPEGREKLAEFQAALKPGGSAQIPGEYFAIEFPEEFDHLITKLFGAPAGEVAMLHIAPHSTDKRVPVRIDIECDDGDRASLDYIEWKLTGLDESQMILSNEDQAIPIQVTHTVDLVNQTSNTSISPKDGPIAAPVLLHFARFLQCMAKPCKTKIWLLDPGLPLGDGRNLAESQPPVDDKFIEVLEELVFVQAKVGVPIYVPHGQFSEEDLEALTILRSLLRTRGFPGTWTDVNFGQTREQALETGKVYLKGDRARAFRADIETALELFGSQIPLGTVVHIFEDAKLANESEFEQWLGEEGAEDDVLQIRLVPGDSNRMTTTYLEWGDWAEEDGD